MRCPDRPDGKNHPIEEKPMRSTLLTTVAAVIVLALSASAWAAGGGGGGGSSDTPIAKPVDANYARAKAMIEAKDYKGALPLLQQVVAKDPKNADAYNLMGFATRKSGDPNASLQYYTTALQIDPKHIGAHEYIGEAYLMLGQLPQAEQHLAKLDSLCVFGCAEYRMLKSAIADYKAGKKPTN
jgi:tetratricopeptide (TPR) repeat protein